MRYFVCPKVQRGLQLALLDSQFHLMVESCFAPRDSYFEAPLSKNWNRKLIFFGYNLEFLHDYPELKKNNKTKQGQLTKTSSNNTFSVWFNLFWYCFYFFWSTIVVYFICRVVGTNGPWFFNFKNCGKVCLTEKGVLVLNSPE